MNFQLRFQLCELFNAVISITLRFHALSTSHFFDPYPEKILVSMQLASEVNCMKLMVNLIIIAPMQILTLRR